MAGSWRQKSAAFTVAPIVHAVLATILELSDFRADSNRVRGGVCPALSSSVNASTSFEKSAYWLTPFDRVTHFFWRCGKNVLHGDKPG